MARRLGNHDGGMTAPNRLIVKNTSPAHWLVARRSGTFLADNPIYWSPLLHMDRFAIRIQGAFYAHLLTLIFLGEFLLVDVVRRPVR
jgi:hypothetical protein